jgi:integrase
LFDEPGSASHLGYRTVNGMVYAYGRWLGYLRMVAPDHLTFHLAERVNVETIEGFCRSLAETNSARAGSAVLQKLRHVLLHLAPATDWKWLHGIAKRIEATSSPRPKTARLRTSDELYQLGLSLMDLADTAVTEDARIKLRQAMTYRDGLMIALLAADPIRRSNFASLTLHQNIVRAGSIWVIVLAAEETKGGKALEYPVPVRVGERLDRYLTHYRHVIHGSGTHAGLWASAKGCPMVSGAIYDAVCRRTKAAFGQPINLHLFRDAAATFWSMDDPVAVIGVRDLLGHRSFNTTDQHYRHSQTAHAARLYAEIIQRRFGPLKGPHSSLYRCKKVHRCRSASRQASSSRKRSF